MKRKVLPSWIIIPFLWAWIICSPIAAQSQENQRPEFTEFPIEGDLKDFLLDFFDQASSRKDFKKKLIEGLEKGDFDIDLDTFLKRNADNPLIRGLFRDILEQAKRGELKLSPKARERAGSKLREIQSTLLNKKKLNPPQTITPPENPRISPPPKKGNVPPTPPPEPSKPEHDQTEVEVPEDYFDEMIQNMVEGINESELGDMLADMPEFQQTMQELGNLMMNDNAGWNPEFFPGFDNIPEVDLPEWELPEFQPEWTAGDLPFPKLPKFRFSPPRNSGRPGRFPTLELPRGSPVSQTTIVACFFLLIVGLLLWRFFGRPNFLTSEKKASLTKSQITANFLNLRTRQELVLAFEEAAQYLLGQDANNWNHRTIVRQYLLELPAQEENRLRKLADLYEKARYSPVGEPLSFDEVRSAGKYLHQLVAGTAA